VRPWDPLRVTPGMAREWATRIRLGEVVSVYIVKSGYWHYCLSDGTVVLSRTPRGAVVSRTAAALTPEHAGRLFIRTDPVASMLLGVLDGIVQRAKEPNT
jgi:hypothetical protein